MTIRSFARPVALPVFWGPDGALLGSMDVWCDGVREIRAFYDGRQNRVEIVPLVRPPGWLGTPVLEVSPPYTISEAALNTRIIEGLTRGWSEV